MLFRCASLLHAVPISLFVLGISYYWFAVADRYAIFLYGHLGATPFDEVTSSRYWMGGLVAAGFVLLGYAVRQRVWQWGSRGCGGDCNDQRS